MTKYDKYDAALLHPCAYEFAMLMICIRSGRECKHKQDDLFICIRDAQQTSQ